jgi:hypothetical protein
MASRNPKIQNQPTTKKNFRQREEKIALRLKFYHQIELVDTKINFFGGLNRYQTRFYLSIIRI